MKFEILSEPRKIYAKMLGDIRRAKRAVFLETYNYAKDEIGRKFRDVLVKKAEAGVEVKVLVDAWASGVDKNFFKKLVDAGGEVRFFREFKYVVRIFGANHERDHRKLLLVDDEVSYIGSINVTRKGIDWDELVLRLGDNLGGTLRMSFMQSWRQFDKRVSRRVRSYLYKGFKVINDVPRKFSRSGKSYRKLIRGAKKEVLIETPYLIPPIWIRRALRRAVKKGVSVKIVLPRRSELKLVDIVRGRYLGGLYKAGVEIYFYPKMSHAKLLIVDDEFFILGSSNLDYRSFMHQFEVNLLGSDKKMVGELRKYFGGHLKKSKGFSYEAWKNRHIVKRIVEVLLRPVRKYF